MAGCPLSLSLSFFIFHGCSSFEFRVGVFRVRFYKSIVNESRRAHHSLHNGSLGFMIGQDLPSRSALLYYLRIKFKSFTSLLQNKGQRLSKMMQLLKRLVPNGMVVQEGLDLEHCLRKLTHKHTKIKI
ncbi:unnamed protein product [Camellia sinensis]